MGSIVLERSLTGLSPVDEQGRAILARYKQGELIRVKTSRVRNSQHHRLFFALLNLVYENQSRYTSMEHMLTALKVALGHCDTVILKDGSPPYIPKSISFASMDQDEFNDFYDRTVKLVCMEILPGVKDEILRREVLEMIS